MIGKKEIAYFVIAAVIIVIIISGLAFQKIKEGPRAEAYATFAQCINDADAEFWGAFWCPHCARQKALFGDSADLLPYIECSEADRSLKQECSDEYIRGYPTWRFANGTQCGGEISELILAELTGCEYPEYEGSEELTTADSFETIFIESARNNLTQQVHAGQTTSAEADLKLELFEGRMKELFEERFGYTLEESKDSSDVAKLFIANNCRRTEEVKEALRNQEVLERLNAEGIELDRESPTN